MLPRTAIENLSRILALPALLLLLAGMPQAHARDLIQSGATSSAQLDSVAFDKVSGNKRRVGIFKLDNPRKVLGGRLHESYPVGGDPSDPELSLVWQRQAGQVSLSKDGLRVMRRF